jgi:hypothetical protein
LHLRSLLKTGIDWPVFLDTAKAEGVAPLLYKNLREFESLLPPHALDGFSKAYYSTLSHNIYVFRKLGLLLQEARSRALRVIVTKGARLAESVYHDPGARPFGDVDLVVHPQDWPVLEGILSELGYERCLPPDRSPSSANRNLDWTFSPYYRLEKLLVEIHCTYLGLHIPAPFEGKAWERSRTLELGGNSAGVFSAEDELCYLCLHAQQHSYQRLIWLTDIAEMASGGGVDWQAVRDICLSESIHAPVYYGLHLVRSLWPDAVAEEVLGRFLVRPFERKLLEFMWPVGNIKSRTVGPSFPYYTPTLFSLIARKKLVLAGRTILRIMLPPVSWVSESFNIPRRSPRIFFRYLRRLVWPLVLIVKRGLAGAK